MKYISPLFAVLAIVSLGQAHHFPDFGNSALHDELKSRRVNTPLVANIVYILLGITEPNNVSVHERSLDDDFVDILKPISGKDVEKINEIIYKYVTEDERVQNGVLYLFTEEFHSALRNTEALKEHHELVIYLEEAGLHVIEVIKFLHQVIGMEDYVPPKIERVME